MTRVHSLESEIQNLVSCVDGGSGMTQITDEIFCAKAMVGNIIRQSQTCGYSNLVGLLGEVCDRLLEALERGQDLARSGSSAEQDIWRQTLPHMTFELARESKALVQRVGGLTPPGRADDFS